MEEQETKSWRGLSKRTNGLLFESIYCLQEAMGTVSNKIEEEKNKASGSTIELEELLNTGIKAAEELLVLAKELTKRI